MTCWDPETALRRGLRASLLHRAIPSSPKLLLSSSMPQPLPPMIPESLNTSPHMLLAYSKLLQLEKVADDSHSNHEVRETRLVYARILGYLIREGPSTNAKERVAQEVNCCSNDDECPGSVKCIMTTTSVLVTRLYSPSLPSF
jgi:hypothetical protein